jgi:hypothetical protein
MTKLLRLHPVIFTLLFFLSANAALPAEILPILEFPEQGMDDPSRYRDYRTRFYRDSKKNALQIYVNQGSGRVVNLWADAANESLSFTARDASGNPVSLPWCDKRAEATTLQKGRFVQYSFCTASSTLEIGHFLLGSMRKERDFQYFKKDLEPYDAQPFYEPELLKLIANLEKLPDAERSGQLKLLRAKSIEEIRQRMDPVIHQNGQTVSLEQISFDGKNHLWLELTFNTPEVNVSKTALSIGKTGGKPIQIQVKVGTDALALTPLDRKDIFNEEFLKFYADRQAAASSSEKAKNDFRWIDREVRGMELVCYQEKLMAGLPNFATYFGRDTMMSAFMFEPVWSVSMMEHAITSVLRKLGPAGDASHEEALGGQAIRENADQYNKQIEQYFKDSDAAALQRSREILQDLQRVRENYNMIDDDFQLPVFIGRYLENPQIPVKRKRAFLEKWLNPVLKNFAYVSRVSRPYIETPDAIHLMGFPKGEDGRWRSSSWRDSGAGYAGGRFAMDVNVVWVPGALESMAATLKFLASNGYNVTKAISTIQDTNRENWKHFLQYVHDADRLQKAVEVWHGAIRHFWVKMGREELLLKVRAKIDSLPDQEKQYWNSVLAQTTNIPDHLEFLALSLDEKGNPIRVLNTDPATWLFLGDHTEDILNDRLQPGTVYKILDGFLLPFPVGLFVQNLGPLCANDAYASPAIWESFEKDQYHSPRVVWGREVNLLTLGLARQILEGSETKSAPMEAYVARLREALHKISQAVEESGLKHNELWSYQIEDGKLVPVRYGSSSDIQLWNLTDLSIQFLSSRIE